MKRYSSLLLSIWREACRHIEIGEWVDAIAPMLGEPLSADLVMVRRIDATAGYVETLAAARCRYGPLPRQGRTEIPRPKLEELVRWCQRGEVCRVNAERHAAPRGLLPWDLEGDVLAGPLNPTTGVPGLLIVAARPPDRFHDHHLLLARELLDPFSVALDNDHRLRELRSLREAVEADNRSLLSKLGRHDISESIVGADSGLKSVMEEVDQVARSDAPVLVLGETGTGKEVVARAIHTRSRRAKGPFLRVNCGAIPPELVDSELFGHEKGSFTGAQGQRHGWFERADGGTLFLDECGELPPAVQVRLLRILQDGMLERVGGEKPIHVDVRIVAATHRDLQALVADGQFRQDLWYRIAVFPIRLPPLRERLPDIPALATHFATRAAQRLGLPHLSLASKDLALLASYDWPGNVRELAAVIERAAILGNGEQLDVARAMGRQPALPGTASLPFSATTVTSATAHGTIAPLDTAVARHIEAALIRTRGRIEGTQGAAALLQINPHTLRARMRKLGLDWRSFRDAM